MMVSAPTSHRRMAILLTMATGKACTCREVQENQEEVFDHLRSLEHEGGGWSTVVDGGSRWWTETSMT
jgi:hypothetical protein